MDHKRNLVKIYTVMICLSMLIVLSEYSEGFSSSDAKSIPSSNADQIAITPEKLVQIGKIVVFGTEKPKFDERETPNGKGQCVLCHTMEPKQRPSDRSPSLLKLESLSRNRVQEERYKMFMDHYSNGEKNTGITPHAKTWGEYLIESLYCPNCYVIKGHGIKGTNDMESPMPIINGRFIELTDFEMVAVVAYLQAKDTPGDYSKVTAKADWEKYFGKRLIIKPEDLAPTAHLP